MIELLIVVAIIGILAAIAIPNFMNAQIRARIARTVADMHALRLAIMQYVIDNEQVPASPARNPLGQADSASRWTLECLTTPIAYLTRPVFEDPFSRTPVYGNYPNYFQYWASTGNPDLGMGANLPRQFVLGVPEGQKNPHIHAIDWILVSVGPSCHWDTSWFMGNFFAPYDPTNGIMSQGIIWMSDAQAYGG